MRLAKQHTLQPHFPNWRIALFSLLRQLMKMNETLLLRFHTEAALSACIFFQLSFQGHFVAHPWCLNYDERPLSDGWPARHQHTWRPVYMLRLNACLSLLFWIPPQTVSQSLLYCSHLSATHITAEETEMSYLSCVCHQHVYCLRINENQVMWHRQLFTLIGQAWGTEILHCIAGAQRQNKWPAQLVIFSKEFSSFHKKEMRSHHQWAAYFCIKRSDLAGKCF